MGYYCKHGRGHGDDEGCDSGCEPIQKLWDETPDDQKMIINGQMQFLVAGKYVPAFYVVGRKPAGKTPYPWCYKPEECIRERRCQALVNCGD